MPSTVCALKVGRLFVQAAERVHAITSASLVAKNKFYHEAVERVLVVWPACLVARNKFYHEVEWHEFDGDGLRDFLTVRVSKNGLVADDYDEGDMILSEDPGSTEPPSDWKSQFIAKGPDVIFKSALSGDGMAMLCTALQDQAPHDGPVFEQ